MAGVGPAHVAVFELSASGRKLVGEDPGTITGLGHIAGVSSVCGRSDIALYDSKSDLDRPQTGPSLRRGQRIGIRQSRFDSLRSLNARGMSHMRQRENRSSPGKSKTPAM